MSLVKVKVLRGKVVLENGKHLEGEVFEVSKERAAKLLGLVAIIGTVSKEDEVLKVAAEPELTKEEEQPVQPKAKDRSSKREQVFNRG